jgi:hypothetical protein
MRRIQIMFMMIVIKALRLIIKCLKDNFYVEETKQIIKDIDNLTSILERQLEPHKQNKDSI